MNRIVLLLVSLFVGLMVQAMPADAVTANRVATPQYTFNSATGALTLNWGEFNRYDNWDYDVVNTTVKSVTATSEVSFTGDCSQLFYNFRNCKSMDLSRVNTSGMTDANRMFRGCESLTSLDLSDWNTANVTNMYEMFRDCESLISLDLSGWDTGNVMDMGLLFYDCYSLTSLDITGWNTANVIDMYYMFYYCESLTSLDLSGFNTGNVSSMTQMFYGCRGLTSLNVSGWNTSNVMTMGGMFAGCTGLTSLDLSGWNTASVIAMNNMFNGCVKLTSLDLSGFNTASLEDIQNMFTGCTGLTSIDISGWNTANVWYMNDMFAKCSGLKTIYAGTGWTTERVNDEWGEGMFTGCIALVGGMGTAYDKNHTDMTYARIDGGASNPGYFTAKHASTRGDVNMDGKVGIDDVTDLIDILLGSVLTVYDMNAADADRDHNITIADVVAILDYILTGNW